MSQPIINTGRSFLDLNDTPSTYVGSGGNICYVNTSETGLTFRPSGGLNYRGLWPPSPVPDPLYLFPDETLTLANSGYYWVVDGDGQDKDGRIWDNGDWIIYNGGDPTLGTGWDQYRPTSNISDKEVRVKAQTIEGTVADFDMVYWNDTSSQWEHALATASATIKMGIVSNLGDGIVTYYGEVDWVAHGLTIGSVYYLSTTVAGGITLTPPTGVGEIVQPVLQPISADRVFIYDFKLDEATGAGGVQPYLTGEAYAVGEQVYYQTTIYEVTTDIPTAPVIPPWASLKAISSGYQKYTVNDDYKVGDFVEFNDGIYEVVIDIDNAPFTPPWASLRNANRTVVATADDGAVTTGDSLLIVQSDGQVAAHDPYIAPTADHHLAPKKYVDDNAGSATIPDWSSGTAYLERAYVRYEPTKTLYRCEISHTSTIDFVADVTAGNWSHLTGYINTAREFQGGLTQQTAFEQVLYMRDNTTPRTPITVTTPGYRDTLVPVAQTPPMTVESTWTLTSSPLLGTASLCDPAKFERRHVSFAGTYFTVGDFIAFGPSISGPFGSTRWEILRVGRTSGDNYHYAEVSPDNCNVPCQQSPSAGAFQTYRPSGADYIDPLAVTAVTDIGGGEWQIDLDDAHDGSGTAILDDTWGVGQAILQFDVDDPATYFVIKSIPSPTSVICEPSAALPTTLISNPAGWLPTVGMNLRTSGVAAPLARITPTVTAVDDNLDGSYNIVFDTNIDGTGLNWTVGHAIVPLSDTSGNTYAALDSFFGANAFRMFPDVSFPRFYLPAVGIQMDTSGTAAQPLPTLGEDPRVPALDGEIANKKYVDDEITKVTGPILGTNGGIAIASAYASSNASFNIPEGPTVSTWTTVNLTIAERYRGQTVNVFANAFMTARSDGFATSDTPILVTWYTNSSLRKRDRILPQASDGTTNTILQIPPHIDNFTIPTGSGDYTLRVDIGFWKENAGRTVTVGNSEGPMRLGAQAYLASGLPIIYLDDLTDVSAGSPAVGDGLIWNGSNYIVSKPTVNPRFLTPVQNQSLGSSHVRIATWGRNTAEIPTGQWCEITIDVVGTFSTTATMNFWLRPSSSTSSLYRGSFTPSTDPTTGSRTGNIHGKLVVQAPGSSLDIQLRIDGGTGTLRYDNTHGYSRITVQPIYL